MKTLSVSILVILLTGCWDTREMSELQIVSAVGIDKIEDQYEISVQIVRAQEFSENSKGESPYIVYSVKSNTILGGVSKLSKKVPFLLYIGHIEYIVIGEEVAKDDVSKVIDGLLRNEKARSDPKMYVSKDYYAKEIISVLHQIRLSSRNSINETVLSAFTISGEYYITRLVDMERVIPLKGKDLSLPVIDIEGTDIEKGYSIENNTFSQSEVNTILNGRSLFVKDKLVGYMYEKDLVPLTWTVTSKYDNNVEFEYKKDCSITVYIDELNDSINGYFNSGPFITIKLNPKIFISEIQCDIDFQNDEEVKEVEEVINNGIKMMYKSSINKAKSLGSDVYGFGEILRRSNNKEWKKIEDNWNELFKTLPVSIEVNTSINNEGPIKKIVKSE